MLAPTLRRLSPNNSQGEYYLTDAIGVLSQAGYPVVTLVAEDSMEAAGVNDRAQLAAAEGELKERINEVWMRQGVTMVDPEQTYIDVSVRLARDVTLLPGVVLEGSTTIGEGSVIGPSSRLVDCDVAPGRASSNTRSRTRR